MPNTLYHSLPLLVTAIYQVQQDCQYQHHLLKHLWSVFFLQKLIQNFPASEKSPLSNSSLLSISPLASPPPSAKILGQSVMNFLSIPPVMVDLVFCVDLVFQISSWKQQEELENFFKNLKGIKELTIIENKKWGQDLGEEGNLTNTTFV